MVKKNDEIVMADDAVLNKIYIIRNTKVMLDKDLANLYNVTTGDLNKAIKRNSKRFPDYFMFQLYGQELKNLIFQIGISSWDGTRHLPYAFTEQGVAMLSGILNSERANAMNIQIMRIFARVRQMLSDNTELRLETVARFHSQWRACLAKQIKKKVNNHDKNIEIVFRYLDELLEKKGQASQRNKISF